MAPTHSTGETVLLKPGAVDLPLLRRIHGGEAALALDPSVAEGMRAAEAAVQDIVGNHKVVYEINTGFGKLASTRISNDHLAELQRNLVLSHSVGTGEPLPPAVVRLVLATKVVSLARGYSGVRPALVYALLVLFNAGITPRIPAKGSVGASGDLAARRLTEMVNNTAVVIGIEAMAAAQGIELKRPLKNSVLLEAEFDAIRTRVAFLNRDRYLAPDNETMRLWALQADGRRSPASLVAILPRQFGTFS